MTIFLPSTWASFWGLWWELSTFVFYFFNFPLSFFKNHYLLFLTHYFCSKMHSRTWGSTQAPWSLLKANMCRFLFTCENLLGVPSPLKHPNPFLPKVYKCFSTIIMLIGVILKWYAHIKDIFSHALKSNFILLLDWNQWYHTPLSLEYLKCTFPLGLGSTKLLGHLSP